MRSAWGKGGEQGNRRQYGEVMLVWGKGGQRGNVGQ